MKAAILFTLALVFVNCHPQKPEDQATTKQEEPSIQKKSPPLQNLLDSLNLTGTLLIYDEAANTYHANDYEGAATGHLPASTFKIPNTIIALETGVTASPEHLFKWDGTDRWFDAWERDLTLKEAFAVSCVPCYQEVARAVGPERMRAEIHRLGYPAMVFDSATVDNFWLRGNSRISPLQQIDFLQWLYHAELPIRPATQTIIRDILVREKTDDYVLSGKTGWTIDGDYNNGWFVGFVERGDEVFYFATNVEPGPEFVMGGFQASRITVTKLALAWLGVI